MERQPRVGQGIHDRLGLQVTDGGSPQTGNHHEVSGQLHTQSKFKLQDILKNFIEKALKSMIGFENIFACN